jgi:microsomal dipeptidase-like Zn-dependent dipeptidase
VDLFRANYSRKEIRGILGENFIRLFQAALGYFVPKTPEF